MPFKRVGTKGCFGVFSCFGFFAVLASLISFILLGVLTAFAGVVFLSTAEVCLFAVLVFTVLVLVVLAVATALVTLFRFAGVVYFA